MNSQVLKVVRVDEYRHMAEPIQQEGVPQGTIPQLFNFVMEDICGEKFPVYEMDAATARQCVVASSESEGGVQYHLYQTPSQTFSYTSPRGQYKAKVFHPFYAKEVTMPKIDPKTGKRMLDPDNGEELCEVKVVWYEDEKDETAVKSGPAAAGVAAQPSENTSKLKQKLDEVEDRCSKMEKGIIQRDAQLKKQKEENEALKKKLEELEKKQNPKEPKGK